MPQTCPHCGERLEDSVGFSMPAFLKGAIDRLGGDEAFGRLVAEDYLNSKGGNRVSNARVIRDFALATDRQRREHQLQSAMGSQEEMDGAAMEYLLLRMTQSEDIRERFRRAIQQRLNLRLTSPRIIEVTSGDEAD